MQKTANYQLSQWEATDKLSREDFNADNAAIDAALKAVADTANGKASTESVTALQQSVNSQIAALTTALGSGGQNCRIAVGSYTGTGAYGASSPNSLSFDFCPALVLLHCDSHKYTSVMVHSAPSALACWKDSIYVSLTWSEQGVSWYNAEDAMNQNNTSGYVFRYIALGYSN